MNDFNREMAMLMAGTGSKAVHGKMIGNVSPYIEWIKWLSYIPDFQKKKIQEINNKAAKDLSLTEINELREYLNQKRMLGLFKMYGSTVITKDEYMEVYDYMCFESIDKLMLSKLSKKELEYAKQEIIKLKELPENELSKKIENDTKEETYLKLSMVEAYILHIVSITDFNRHMMSLEAEIQSQLDENDQMRQKSCYYASNPYKK